MSKEIAENLEAQIKTWSEILLTYIKELYKA
jgi:hypothetical protein